MSDCYQPADFKEAKPDPLAEIQGDISFHKALFKEIARDISSVHSRVDSLVACVDENDKDRKQVENILKKKFNEISAKQDALEAIANDLKVCQNSILNDLSSLKQAMVSQAEVVSKKASADQLESLKNQFRQSNEHLLSQYESCRKDMVSLRDSLSSLKSDNEKSYSSFKSMLSQIMASLKEESGKDALLKQELQNKLENERQQASKDVAHLKQLVDERFAHLKLPQAKDLEPDIKKIINSFLDPFYIEINNSSLKSGNSDMRCNMMEKKLDQVFILLKKFELMR